MNHYGGYLAYDVMYDTGGHLVDPRAEAEMLGALQGTGAASGAKRLFLISHGWNNNIDEARALYAAFFSTLRSAVLSKDGVLNDADVVLMAIFWPSKRFTDTSLIPGGAASVGQTLDQQLNGQLDQLKEVFASDPSSAAKIEHARAQISKLEVSQAAQDDFVYALKSLLPQSRGPRDEGLDDAREELDSPALSGHIVLQRLSVPLTPVLPPPLVGGATSLAAGTTGAAAGLFGNIIGGIKAGASSFANLLTFYTMKDRAGIVGSTGVAQTIQKIRGVRTDLEVHLIGHSFGGRLVTAAANAQPAADSPIVTMSLLQAAYSHNGLAKDWDGAGNDGGFRSVVSDRKVKRSILISHSVHDFPVGTAYPLASRIMGMTAAALVGGPNDKFGGMGRNGAQHTPEAIDDTLHVVGTPYLPFAAGKWIRNLNGDGPAPAPTITSHGDIAKPEIAYAFLSHI